MRSLILSLTVTAAISAQTQTPPIRIDESVTVSARDAKTVADALRQLRSSRDPLVAQTIADNIVKLTDAMAVSGRVNEIGPITDDEGRVIDIRDSMEKYSFPGGPIYVRPRNADSTAGPRLFQFTRTSFIAMCADMASTPLVEVRGNQENKMIAVARMIADINEQRANVISEGAVLEGALAGFKNQDPKGTIIGRVEGIADALAVNADHNQPYDLVPAAQHDAFGELGHMDRGVFEVVAEPRMSFVNVAYDGKIYAASVDHFVWFFIRFLLADEGGVDPEGLRARRVLLGSHLLDHLTEQLQARVLQSVLAALKAPAKAGAKNLVLGDFYARGPGLDALKGAPGLAEEKSELGPDYRTLMVPARHLRDIAELRDWLTQELSKRTANQIR